MSLPPIGSNPVLLVPRSLPTTTPSEEGVTVTVSPGSSDPDRDKFAQYAATLRELYLKWIPTETIMQTQLSTICERISPADQGEALIRELYKRFSTLHSQHSAASLIAFITDKLIPSLDEKKQEDASIILQMCYMVFMLETGREDLLLLPPADFLGLVQTTADQHALKRAAVKSYIYLAHVTQRLLKSIEMASFATRLKVHQNGLTFQVVNHFNIENAKALNNNPAISLQRKKDLHSAFRKLATDFTRENVEFIHFYTHVLDSDLVHMYLPLLTSEQANTICDLRISTCASFDFVEKNRAIYDDCIPNFEEMVGWIAEKSKSLQETAALMQDFALFIHLGNLDKISELPPNYISSAQFFALLSKEIHSFKGQMKELDMAKKTVALFGSNPLVLKQRQIFTIYEQFYASTHSLCQHAASGILGTCRQLSGHLPLPPPPSPFAPPAKKEKRQSPKKQETLTISPDAAQELPSQSLSIPSAATGKKSLEPQQPSLMGTFTLLRQELSCSSAALMKASKALGFKEALKNSQDHLDDLLGEAGRFARLLKKPLVKEQLFSTLVHFINHGTLLIEQLLTAKLRKTQAFKDKKAMTEAVTHQLPLLLNRCHFGHFPLSQQARNTILQTNLGEILSRDLVSLTEQRPPDPLSSAKGLLAAAYSWMRAEGIPPSDLLIRSCLDYLADILSTCQELQIHIQTNDPEVGKISMEEQKQTTLRIASFKRRLLKEAEQISFNPQPQQAGLFSAQLDSLQAHFAHVLSDPTLPLEIRRGFENLQHNYLCRLKTELHFHADLPPKEIRLHYSRVLLLTQYMAEEFLYQLLALNDKEVDPAEIDHDLVQLAAHLGHSLKDFPKEVQDFLRSGKEIRALMRYRFSYQQGGALQENVHNVSRLAETQVFGEEQDAKFTLVEGKKGSIQAMMQHIAQHVSALHKLIDMLSEH